MMKLWNYTRSAREMAMELSEGLPGALNVVRQIAEGLDEEDAKLLFTFMATMDMRGPLLFAAYIQCDRSVQQLINRVAVLETGLVDSINAEQERESAPGRCVYDGAIEWPSMLPDPSVIRQLGCTPD